MTSANQHLSQLIGRQGRKTHIYLAAFFAAIPVAVILSLSVGASSIDLLGVLINTEVNRELAWVVLWEIRLPRILMTLVTGAGLAISGVVLQSLCRNPLADPGLIGVSAGAALFAAIGIWLTSLITISSAIAPFLIPIMAFTGAILSIVLLFAIAAGGGKLNNLILILSGVAINAAAITLLGFVTYLVDDDTLRLITFWSYGSYAGIQHVVALLTLAVVVVGALGIWRQRNALMLIALNEQQARVQGINTDKVKYLSLCAVAAIVAVCVSFTGIVGFVGLVVPHICRMLLHSHLRVLLPAAALVGALLVTLSDTIARTVIAPSELPVGLITSLLGIPFFLTLILQEKRKFGHV